jgi:phosphoglycolate phosphatase
MTRRGFDLLVFDWDGTLADSTTAIAEALQRACHDIGCGVPDDLAARYVIGLGLVDALTHIAPHLPQTEYQRLSARYREHYLAREADIPLFPGARDLLRELRDAGYRMAVATGKSRLGLNRALAKHELVSMFDATRCADEGQPKPHPDMLHYLMRALDADPARTVMIGDTTHDLVMAERAGVESVGLAHGAHPAEILAPCRPLIVVRSIADLRVWLSDQ